MSSWTWQIPFGLFWGALIFAALLVPALFIQYRRYGRLSLLRLAGTAAVSIYGVSLVAYTLLPLPDPSICSSGGAGTNLVPFAAAADIAEEAADVGLRGAMTSWVTLQTLLNIVLFVPLGLAVRALAGRGVLAATSAGLAVSVLIEVTQLTGLWGVYDCAYRVADVDDVLLNTGGALIGAVLAPVALGWMPRARDLVAAPPRPVGRLRRLLGMLADAVLATVVAGGPALAWNIVQSLTVPAGQPWAEPRAELPLLGLVIAAAIVFYLPALTGTGASLGQRLVGIAPRWHDGHGSVSRRLARASVMGGTFTLGDLVVDLLGLAGVPVLPALLSAGCWLLLAAGIIVTLLVDRRGLSGMVGGADMVDRRLAGGAGKAPSVRAGA